MIEISNRIRSPENLNSREYSNKSDVWSFAVLLYEVFTDGAVPYGDLDQLITVATVR